MAGTTGLEPAASAVTGQRSNQLNYVPTRQTNWDAQSQVFLPIKPPSKKRTGFRNQIYPNSFSENAKDPAASIDSEVSIRVVHVLFA
jgi:hypothetical protein